ncbi:MAG: sigma-70 family RNA polymerase sigma factor [Candidatus Limnocylindrales bacterium]
MMPVANAAISDAAAGATDNLIFQRVCTGDTAAVADLYDKYASSILGLAMRVTNDRGLAENVVQEAFVDVWRNASKFDASRGSARTWIMAIAHHRAVDAVRRRRRETVSLDADNGVADSVPAVSDIWKEVSAGVDAAAVRRALAALPAIQRQAVELAYFSGLTQLEIAAATGAPHGTVKSRVRLGLARLRELMAGEFEGEFAV